MKSKQLKSKAYKAFRAALKTGEISRKPCEICGSPKSQGHHEDYSKPLDVRWLCALHHVEAHGRAAKSRIVPEKTGTLADYFPRKVPLSLVQAQIPTEVRDKIKGFIDSHNLTWNHFVHRLFLYFIENREEELDGPK